jgi:proteasome assembly chaperone (PAC2) family protein
MENPSSLIISNRPKLRQPHIVCGMDGWVDGGDVATGGLRFLIRQFNAVKFAEMTTPRFHIYQMPDGEGTRPAFKMEDGLIVETHFPTDEFFYAQTPASDHDLIFFLGTEPNLYWEEYADNIVNLAAEFKAARLYSLGGILDRTPYTRWPRLTCTCTGKEIRTLMEAYNVIFSTREGPASSNLLILNACKKKGLEGVNLTVRVPYYPEFNIAMDFSPKSIKAVLMRYNYLAQLDLNFDELDTAIQELDGKLDFVRQQNPQFNTYLEELEKAYVELPYQEPMDMSGNDAVRFAEEFLKQNKDKPSE